MSTSRRLRHAVRAVALLLITSAVMIGLLAGPTTAADASDPEPSSEPSATPSAEPSPSSSPSPSAKPSEGASRGPSERSAAAASLSGAAPHGAPYGAAYPVELESNFTRPVRSAVSGKYGDGSQMRELERLIRGTYVNQQTGRWKSRADRFKAYAFMSVSRMEDAIYVNRELVKAAKAGVAVRFIHPDANISPAARKLAAQLNARGLRNSAFKFCRKGKSAGCFSSYSGAIVHTKMLMVGPTYTKANDPAINGVWYGSPNIGGPSSYRTYNNGITVYNDKKFAYQSKQLFTDMWSERNVGNNVPGYVARNTRRFGYSGAEKAGYSNDYATGKGYLYSNLSNVTLYPSPVYATPTNGRDPVMQLLRRVVPSQNCRIRVQHNRFKYRRIAVAVMLSRLADQGCKVEVVAFEDDLKQNYVAHCQLRVRICKPILAVLKSSMARIKVAWAKPHDKVILVEAQLKPNPLNGYERPVDGSYGKWGGERGTVFTRLVQTGSAGLTGSNLVASDEMIMETTDKSIFDDYDEHWNSIEGSYEWHRYYY